MSESSDASGTQTTLFSTYSVESDSSKTLEVENRVTFRPALHDWRRAWILNVLRKEKVTSVLDVGCGEGSLLTCLSFPSFFLPYSPNQFSDSDPNIEEDLMHADDSDIHLTQIAGLDLSLSELEECARATEPYPDEPYASRPRWEPLAVDLWHGSLAVTNDSFKNYECIVSSEVIEHLPPDILPTFAPILLGLYEPRLLLLTTPNYTFNARFTAPGVVDPYKYVDPTGRTTRVFRHSDHKFEWTVEEFTEWCKVAAQEWDYEVEVDAIGTPMEKDPWGRDAQLGKASQVAAFRKIEGEEAARRRARRWREFEEQPTEGQDKQPHKLFKKHFHEPHLKAGKPASKEEILASVRKYMEGYYTEDGYTLGDLWVSYEISVACGGYLRHLVDAVTTSAEFRIDKSKAESEDGGMPLPLVKWPVFFAGEKHLEAISRTDDRRLWPREGERREGTPDSSSLHSDEPEGDAGSEEESEGVVKCDDSHREMGVDGVDEGDRLQMQMSETGELPSQNGWIDRGADNGWGPEVVDTDWGAATDWRDRKQGSGASLS